MPRKSGVSCSEKRNTMKKIISLLLALVLLVLPLAACGDGEKETVRLGGMTGPTSIGMAHLLDEDAKGSSMNDYEFTLASAGDEIKTKLLQGDLDIAAVPANLAAALYNATEGKIKLLAVNTFGVVSILEKGETVQSVADLAGKKVYAPATARGAIPELVFNYLLSVHGVTDVTVEWIEATGLAAKLKSEAGAIVLSPEPNATAILANVEGSRRALHLGDEWAALDNGAEYVTGVVVARTAFIEENPTAVENFLKEYAVSVAYANESTAETARLTAEFKILSIPEKVIERSIPYANIRYMDGEEMKTVLKGFIDLVLPGNPKAFGGKAPDDGFYYVK